MSFVGDLEHLPIVDIIQLLHSTRKSGTLCLKCRKGESQLVFKDGYIVSANHVNNSVRIGRVLVEMNAITPEVLENALLTQKSAGANRAPLVALLLEAGQVKKEDAFKGLETLIELTIVEVLTWTTGTFALDVDKVAVSDEYRYFPEKLKQDITLDTQSVLMDALRIYDEKMRDGTLSDEEFFPVEPPPGGDGDNGEGGELSADDLGLGDLDGLEKKIPDVFLGLKDYDPAEIHRQKIREELREMPFEEQEKLFSYLMEVSHPAADHGAQPGSGKTIIVFSRDELMRHTLMTVCRHEGFFVFTTDEETNLDIIVDQSLAKDLVPVLVVDLPERGGAEEEMVGLLHQKREKYPQISMLQLVSPRDYRFSLRALEAGVRAVFPRPGRDALTESFAEEMIAFLAAFRCYVKKSFSASDQPSYRKLRDAIVELGTLREPAEVSFVLLRFAAAMFERTITFVVGNSELIAERGIGVRGERGAGATPSMKFRLPLAQPSVFQEVIENGHLFYGPRNDVVLRNHLFAEIGAPVSARIIVIPIKHLGRVIALVYGDFGTTAGSPVRIDPLDILARHAGMVLDNALYGKRSVKPAQSSIG